MAKKRLNTRFLKIAVASVLGLVVLAGGSVFIKRRFFREKPDKYLAAGKEAFAAHNYERARDNLIIGAGLAPPDAATNVMIGDTLNNLTYKNPDYVSAARGMWDAAIGIDPTYVPAMERLVTFWQDQLDMGMRNSERAPSADQLSKAADKLLQLDPQNRLAQRAAAESIIEIMLDGRPTPPSRLNEAEESLLKVMAQSPADPYPPFWIARSRLHQALDSGRSDDSAGATVDLHQAESVMEDAVRSEPDNSSIAYHAGQIFLQAAAIEQILNRPVADITSHILRATDLIDRARLLVKPEDSEYVDINLFDARLVLSQADPSDASAGKSRGSDQVSVPAISENPLVDSLAESPSLRHSAVNRVKAAEDIYRSVLKNRPNDPYIHIALAQLLGDLPGRRKSAIALLSTPFVDDHPVPGLKGTLLPLLQSQADIRLLGLQLDELDVTRDKPTRDALLAQAIPLSDKITAKNPDSPSALGLKGRLEMAQDRIPDATRSLRRALALIDPNNGALTRTRYELMFSLARAYEAAQQTGEAKSLAIDVVALYPKFVPAQLMLARLLVAERDFAGAKPHLDALSTASQDNPALAQVITRLRLASTDPEANPEAYQKYYAQLPETNREERLDKARLAKAGNLDADAVRLLDEMRKASPGDVAVVQLLGSIYAKRNQVDLARKLVDDAVAASPSDPTLVTMKMRLDGKPQTEIDAALQRVGGTAPEQLAEFNREILQVASARSRGDGTAIDAHLAAAQKLKPDDARLWDAQFTRDLDLAAWDKAQAVLDKLAANDVDRAGGTMYRIRLASAQNDFGKAQDLALKLTRDKPEFSQSWCVLGDVQFAEGKYEDAQSSYNFALKRQTQNFDALRGLVRCSYAMSNPTAASDYIQQALKIDPKDPQFKELALSHELTYGDPQKVIGPREITLKENPDNPVAYANLGATYIAAAQARRVAKDAAGADQYSQLAETTYKDAIAKFPEDQRFPLAFARVALQANDFASAEQAMMALAARPAVNGSPGMAVVMGDFYDHAGKPDQAVAVLQAYLANPVKPTNVDADVNVELRLAGLLTRLGRKSDAIAALSSNPTHPAIVQEKIGLLIQFDRIADADKLLIREVARGPLPPALQNLQGLVQAAEGQPAEARETFSRILVQHPDNVDALVHRAKLSMDDFMPNFRAAIEDLSHARDIAPSNVEVALQLAQVRRKHGDFAGAAKDLEVAIRKVPADKQLRLNLIDLYASQQQWDDAKRILHDASLIPELAGDADFTHAGAVVAMGRGDYPAAEQLIQDAIARAPGNLNMLWTNYDILLHEKSSSQVMSQTDDLLASKNNDPSLWRAYTYRARARLIESPDKTAAADELQKGLASAVASRDEAAVSQVMHDYTDLIGVGAAMQAAKQRATESSHWQMIVAGMYQQEGDAAEAINWYEQALHHFDTLGATDQIALLTRAAVAYQNLTPPEVSKAAELYRRLIAIRPADVATLNNLACLLAEPGPGTEPKEALGYAERAYTLMTQAGADEPFIRDTYGWTLIASGKPDEGASMVQDALNKKDFPEAHYHLAEAMLMRTPPDSDNAASELRTALQMLDRNERDGKAADANLRARLQQELARARRTAAG